ncbi:Evolved beta-galactosidase subunit alpha [Pontiella desulfatans]|uniref:beta-galactosidase n=1 Tax=Pontiella desulfatans TaxID=2750659 RepID=A0A6C2U120_PONDE|nr:glycoside hydrolase family 2 TIM barrel-domain containing protein [Pontiella desulfatans]VGO13587.1 Evolved beta-galactosidase subunit alpha [Pontiella desulfatans]
MNKKIVLFNLMLLAGFAHAEVPRLSPLPTENPTVKESVMELSGVWQFAYDVKPDAWQGEVDYAKWDQIRVPGQWGGQGYWLESDDELRAIYTRTIDIPSDWNGQRVKLQFDGFVGPAEVFINGKTVGKRIGFPRHPEERDRLWSERWGIGHTAFEWDVTEACQPGKENRMVVVMQKSPDMYDHADCGGLMRPLRLVALPAVNVSLFHVSTELDETYTDAVVDVEIELTNEGASPSGPLAISLQLTEWKKDQTVAKAVAEFKPLAAGESRTEHIKIPVKSPKKWDPEHPNLYMAHGTLALNKKAVMKVERSFGVREIEVRGTEFLVNGVAVKARGTNRHETHPILGRGIPEAMQREDAELFRAANVNFIRTSHYPPDGRFLDICDEVGLMVEVEAPFWGWHWGTKNQGVPLTDEFGDLIMRSTLEMVQRDRSHPSVVLWSLANECDWNEYFENAYHAVRKLDPARPTIFDMSFYKKKAYDNGLCEVAASHYPGQFIFDLMKNETRPVFLGEYAHLYCYDYRELGYDPGLRDLWGPGFIKYWNQVDAEEQLMGGTIWCGIDSIFFIDTAGKNVGDVEQNFGLHAIYKEKQVEEKNEPLLATGCGAWGFIDGWRREKPEYWYIKKAYAPIQLSNTTIGSDAMLEIENRNFFSNLDEFRFEWSAGDKTGTATADVAPQETGTLKLKGLRGVAEDQSVILRAISPLGFEVNRWKLAFADAPKAADKKTTEEHAVSLKDNGDGFGVTAGSLAVKVDATGSLQIEKEGDPIVTGGPHLMVLEAVATRKIITKHEPNTPASPVCSNWKSGKISAKKIGADVVITIPGSYDEADGFFTVAVKDDGTFDVAHDFKLKKDLKVLQTGVVLDLPRVMDQLSWERDAELSIYPDDHIGRPVGSSPAFYPDVKRCGVFGPLSDVDYPWSQDATDLGCNDFRSTKYNVFTASLSDADGNGLRFNSDASQHVRCWVLPKMTRMLAADYSGHGSEHHCKFGTPREMNSGTVVVGRATFEVK